MGGFCLFESSDTDMSSIGTIYDGSGNVNNEDDNREVLTFRLSNDDFTALETRWTDAAQYESATGN